MMTEEKYNFVKIYERSFQNNWDRPAVTDYGTDVTLTYGQLAINIEKLHVLFKECGVKKDDKIAVMGRNTSPLQEKCKLPRCKGPLEVHARLANQQVYQRTDADIRGRCQVGLRLERYQH